MQILVVKNKKPMAKQICLQFRHFNDNDVDLLNVLYIMKSESAVENIIHQSFLIWNSNVYWKFVKILTDGWMRESSPTWHKKVNSNSSRRNQHSNHMKCTYNTVNRMVTQNAKHAWRLSYLLIYILQQQQLKYH